MSHEQRRRSNKMTDERKNVFLKVLAETGSTTAAASAATPWAEERHGGLQSFRDERKRDPAFSEDWSRAEESALAAVEAEIMKRAMSGSHRPIVSQGRVVAHEVTHDNKLLLAVARKLAPESWTERRQLEHGGKIEHQHDHRHAHAVAVLEPRDVLRLPDAEQQQLLSLIEKIEEAKGNHDEQPKQLHSNGSA